MRDARRSRFYGIERVLMTADAVGGVWTYALELARELSRFDIAVTLATMGPEPTDAQRSDAAQIPGLELATSTYRLEWMEQPWSDVEAAGDWLLSLADRCKPDVVHLNGFCHAALPWQAPTLVVCHSDVLSWWQAVKRAPAPDDWTYYAERVRAGLLAADLVVAPTKWSLDATEATYGPLPHKRVIPNGIDFPVALTPRKRERVFSAGRFWDEAKNLSTLDRAAKGIAWPVCVAGDAGDHAAHLVPLGRLSREQMAVAYAEAAIYAHPAKYEPFGLAVLEAAMSGCALVLGDIPTLRELWHGAALFVDPFCPDSIEDAVNYLIAHPAVRRQMACAANERAQSFSARTFGCNYLFAYQDLKQGLQAPILDGYSGVSLL